ncbi:hypothetical protein KRZ98_17270 [Sphingobium sp. AS12]|uniref:hypothetical protein n=1 Tax=Sphingobium sp. AS12 TaxID=2849495 RepID=UPI001C3194C0|nr:hypothetical protein [Sphingobium sp. AS12]MBV2149997.1 hypothetical protein [Sphingobium sp. AS12]
MAASSLAPPTHLAIFVTDPENGNPVQRLPLYAEIAVPRIVPPRPPADARLGEPINAALNAVDPTTTSAVRARVEAAALAALGQALSDDSLESLLDLEKTRALFERVFKDVLRDADATRMADISSGRLSAQMLAAVRELAPGFGLELVDPQEETGAIWAEPLGVLTTDHVGYASFDLTRLRPEVKLLLAETIAARQNDPDAVLKLAIWIYPYGHPGRHEVLAQARFAFDAIVARMEMVWHTLPPALINMGPRALQNPGLTDWRLSPASFAASPKSLVGEDGCEELFPASLALQQFVLRQVVRLADAPPEFKLPAGSGYKAAYVDDYKVSWYSLGHSLGEILYSLPLAPGETVRLAVIDWSWDSLTDRNETTKLTEDILHQTHRDRTISETVKAGLKELQKGSSLMGGMASAAGATGGASLGMIGLGAAVGNTWSLGGSTATSSGSRDLAAENVQRVNDSFAQASSAQRELSSTVVIQARQEEKQSVQSRTFSNYNHSHTLTVLYYEVLRHYRVTVEWVRRRPAVLAKLPERVAALNEAVLINHRHLLEPALLEPALKAGFDAIEKRDAISNHQIVQGIGPTVDPVDPWWEGTVELELFEIGIWTNDDTINNITIYVITAEEHARSKKHELHYVYKGESDAYAAHNVNSGQRMETDQEQFTFLKLTGQAVGGPSVRIPWSQVIGFQFEKWGNTEWRIDALSIKAWDRYGYLVELTPGRVDVNLFILGRQPGSQAFSGIKRPGPPAPAIGPALSPDKSLTIEESYQIKKLKDHIAAHVDHYATVIQLGTDVNAIARLFELVPWAPTTMDDHVEPTPLEVFGSYVAYPLVKPISGVDDTLVVDIASALNGSDPAQRQRAVDQLAAMSDADRASVLERLPLASAKSERLITLPTRGVFAEGKLGHCNVSEEIDNTRFWKWDEHPIPIQAPEIGTITPVTPTPQDIAATPTAFPQSLVNIVNPTPAPDPSGLGAALGVLATANIFRDMSGQAQVADLLETLSNNSVKIAEVALEAQKAATSGGASHGSGPGDDTPPDEGGDTTPTPATQPPKTTPPPAQDERTPEKKESDKIDNGIKKLEAAKENFPPKDQAKVRQQVIEQDWAKPKRKSKEHIKFNIDLKGYGNNLLVGRFGVDVKQRGTAVGWLMATDYSREGQLEIGVSNEFDDPRYQVEIHGEVLGGVGINALLRGRDIVQIPREDFDQYDYFYLEATAEVGEFEFETTKSDEIAHEVAKKIGGGVDAEFAAKATITAKTEGGVEWKDGTTHTSATAVKLKIAYYKGGFKIAYVKKS